MKKLLKSFANYFCYCGVGKEKYNKVKKAAYASNFNTWRFLHCLMAFIFGLLFIGSFFVDLLVNNRIYYCAAFGYSALMVILFFFVFKKDALLPQLVIYLTISILFLTGTLLSMEAPEMMAVSFVVMLVITPMFMIDKPFYMTIELVCASIIYLIWASQVKSHELVVSDAYNIGIYGVVGIYIHIFSNSIRIKEFVLKDELAMQKDTDELTGLLNKSAMKRIINEFFESSDDKKAIMMALDIDNFKRINDTFGHDSGDVIINEIGELLSQICKDDIVGRFGGDEFIIFTKDNDDLAYATKHAKDILEAVNKYLKCPGGKPLSISIGVAVSRDDCANYSELFKHADTALYKAKDSGKNCHVIY